MFYEEYNVARTRNDAVRLSIHRAYKKQIV